MTDANRREEPARWARLRSVLVLVLLGVLLGGGAAAVRDGRRRTRALGATVPPVSVGPVDLQPPVPSGRDHERDQRPTGDEATVPSRPSPPSRPAVPSRPSGPSGPRRRRRWVRLATALLAVVVFGGLLVGADAAARAGAETLLARNVQDATGTFEEPEVHVRGVAFLPQVIRGSYREVDLTTVGVTSGPLRIARVDSLLTDVRVPFHDVLVRDVRGVAVGRSVQDVRLSYADLNTYFLATGRPLRLSRSEDGRTRVDGAVDVLGRGLTVTADVAVTVSSGQLMVTPVNIDIGESSLGSASRLLLNQRLTLSIPTDTLPFGQEVSRVTPTADGLEVIAQGSGIVIRP